MSQNKIDYLQLLNSLEFNQAEPEPAEQIVFRIQFKTIGSLGDFVALSGRQKAGKSLYVSAAMSAAMYRKEIMSLSIKLPEAKKKVAHFDTEQSKVSHYKMMARVKKFSDADQLPDHFKSYRLRSIEPRNILLLIETYLKHNPECGIVFLDGLLDTLDSMNDEKHSSFIKHWLKRITEGHNILLIGVIHRGFSSDKSIGQIGSAVDRIAQSVLKVEKNKETKQIVLYSEYLRDDDDIEPIAAYYNKQISMWEQTEFIQDEKPQIKGRTAMLKRRPSDYELSEHTANVYRIFTTEAVFSHSELMQRIVEVYAVGRTWAKECVPILEREDLIYRTADGYTNRKQGRLLKVE